MNTFINMQMIIILLIAHSIFASVGCGRTDFFGDLVDAYVEEMSTDDEVAGETKCLPHPFELEVYVATQGVLFDGNIDLTWELGTNVSRAGDVNGGGYDDILISNSDYIDELTYGPKESYLIFGATETIGPFDLSSIDGTNGMLIVGTNVITSTGVGDVNGDGYGDLLVGENHPASPWEDVVGQAFLIFGGPRVISSGNIELASLDGDYSVRFEGTHINDGTGASVSSAGDVNGDEFLDLLIGAPMVGPDDSHRHGVAYLIYGGPHLEDESVVFLSSLDGTNGVRLNGRDHLEFIGVLSSAGDVNSDGFDDVLIGTAWFSTPSEEAGEAYLVFGSTSVGVDGDLDLASLDGSNGIRFGGFAAGSSLNYSVSGVGNFNGDDYNDIIITVAGDNTEGDWFVNTYLIYGGFDTGVGAFDLTTINGFNGFQVKCSDRSPCWTRGISAGDVDADGYQDILVSSASYSGDEPSEVYLLLGGTELATDGIYNLETINGSNGVKFIAVLPETRNAFTFSEAGDFNADGYGDLLFGTPLYSHSPPPPSYIGRAYLIFGGPTCL